MKIKKETFKDIEIILEEAKNNKDKKNPECEICLNQATSEGIFNIDVHDSNLKETLNTKWIELKSINECKLCFLALKDDLNGSSNQTVKNLNKLNEEEVPSKKIKSQGKVTPTPVMKKSSTNEKVINIENEFPVCVDFFDAIRNDDSFNPVSCKNSSEIASCLLDQFKILSSYKNCDACLQGISNNTGIGERWASLSSGRKTIAKIKLLVAKKSTLESLSDPAIKKYLDKVSKLLGYVKDQVLIEPTKSPMVKEIVSTNQTKSPKTKNTKETIISPSVNSGINSEMQSGETQEEHDIRIDKEAKKVYANKLVDYMEAKKIFLAASKEEKLARNEHDAKIIFEEKGRLDFENKQNLENVSKEEVETSKNQEVELKKELEEQKMSILDIKKEIADLKKVLDDNLATEQKLKNEFTATVANTATAKKHLEDNKKSTIDSKKEFESRQKLEGQARKELDKQIVLIEKAKIIFDAKEDEIAIAKAKAEARDKKIREEKAAAAAEIKRVEEERLAKIAEEKARVAEEKRKADEAEKKRLADIKAKEEEVSRKIAEAQAKIDEKERLKAESDARKEEARAQKELAAWHKAEAKAKKELEAKERAEAKAKKELDEARINWENTTNNQK